jgi:hypothetical protein
VVVAVAIALVAYRTISRKRALRDAVARAELDVRYDTADGYAKAAEMLKPFAEQDPLEAASLRAFSLAMLALDYGDAAAGDEAERLLEKPERADPVPRWANLARAAQALRAEQAGTVMKATLSLGGDPVADLLVGRAAVIAGSLDAALEPLHAAAAAEPPLPAALALYGDVVRRGKRDARAAQAAYARALGSSGGHVQPRAAFGMAKLALTGQAPPAEATEPLERLAADPATPPRERGRAALHAAALAIRAGDRARATTLLDAAGLAADARDWAGRAAAVEADTGRIFRAVSGAPASLVSPTDDDPPAVPAIADEPAPPPPPKAAPPKAAPVAKKAPAKAAPAKKKPPAAKKGAKKSTRH